MTSTTFIFLTFSAEIILGFEIWFEVVFFFEIRNLNCSNFITWKDEQNIMIEYNFRKF
jgi:hypothetical protein